MEKKGEKQKETVKVNELEGKKQVPNIVLLVVEKGETREGVTRPGAIYEVCNTICRDETGDVKVGLWGDEIKCVQEGDMIRIINGYVIEYNGELRLFSGKKGVIETKILGEKKRVEGKGPTEEEIEDALEDEREARCETMEEDWYNQTLMWLDKILEMKPDEPHALKAKASILKGLEEIKEKRGRNCWRRR